MTPDQAAFLAKKKEKAAIRRAKPEDKGELGLTSLMDIVSIIVVYLLKSYASDPVIISPTAGQKIPLSTADMLAQAEHFLTDLREVAGALSPAAVYAQDPSAIASAGPLPASMLASRARAHWSASLRVLKVRVSGL